MWRAAFVAATAFFMIDVAQACEPTEHVWAPASAGFESAWRAELDQMSEQASAVYWARLNSPSTMPPLFASALCNGAHWGNGGDGPFYCGAESLSFTVRETLAGIRRTELALLRAQTGYVEVRHEAQIPCCVGTSEREPAPSAMNAAAMGGCGPTVLMPGRSYVVAVYPNGVRFLGPIERHENLILGALRR